MEHIWLADIDASAPPLKGTIANEPGLPGFKFMQRVDFKPSRITDWMYLEDGYLVGAEGDGVLNDPLALSFEDSSSQGEQRFISVGMNVF